MAQHEKKTNGSKNAERIDLRHKQIIEAAGRVFTRKGFHSATVQDVADEAGLGKGTLYEYVSSKKELLFFVIEESMKEYLSTIALALSEDMTPIQKMRTMLREALRHIDNHRDISKVLIPIVEGLPPEDQTRIDEIFRPALLLGEQVLNEGVRAGVMKPGINVAIISELLHMCCHTWISSERVVQIAGTSEKFEEIVYGMCFEGILNR